MTDLAEQLGLICKKLGVDFTLKSGKANFKDVFSERGLMPAIMKRADQLSSLCLGYGLGATYEDTEGTLVGSTVKLDEFTPNVLRIFCVLDVLLEVVRASPTKEAVSLDELMYD